MRKVSEILLDIYRESEGLIQEELAALNYAIGIIKTEEEIEANYNNIGEIVKTDNIKNPSHYTQGKIQVWDFIIDQQLEYCAGNAIKYICRAKYKGNEKEDLMKAREYIEKLIKGLEVLK